jgi:hypothetical protein
VRGIFPAKLRGTGRRTEAALGREAQQLFLDKEGRRVVLERVLSSKAKT